MLKLLVVLPMLVVGAVLIGAGALAFLPLLALLPVLLAAGAAIFAVMFAFGIIAFIVRLLCAVFVGAGALVLGGIGLAAMLAGGAVVFALGLVFAHLLLPLLVVAGIVWLIHRAGRPQTPPPIAHG